MQKTQLMRKLWEKAEASSNEREKMLLELAGNLVEATFTTEPILDAIDCALQDALNNGEPKLQGVRNSESIEGEVRQLLSEFGKQIRFTRGGNSAACPRCGSSDVVWLRTTATKPYYFEYACDNCGKVGGGFDGDAEQLMWHAVPHGA